ncbi:hypothetical protein EUX98_g6083 [Antrodiella citrinella]|uniref:Uncharacterized protein n=1 Tax=Antrodiella citrinella TaxID=2447956 RepID=A0A4V3XI83_9APHY|nr:hypothetical protein EUX98_g6083 [Antrodiella citrinella]
MASGYQPARGSVMPSFTKLVHVPQKQWIPNSASEDGDSLAPFASIPFVFINPAVKGPGKVSPGVPLAYITAQSENANLGNIMVDVGEKVFNDAYRAYLRVLWPGYEHVEFVTSIPLKTVTGRINRGQVAQFVVKTMTQYFVRLQTQHCLPTQKVWAVAPVGRWRVEDLVLVALHLVHGNTFQAEFKVNTE